MSHLDGTFDSWRAGDSEDFRESAMSKEEKVSDARFEACELCKEQTQKTMMVQGHCSACASRLGLKARRVMRMHGTFEFTVPYYGGDGEITVDVEAEVDDDTIEIVRARRHGDREDYELASDQEFRVECEFRERFNKAMGVR